MKKAPFIVVLAMTFLAEIVSCFYFVGKIENVKQDTVAVNECIYSISENFGDETKYRNSLSYILLDTEGNVLYSNKDNMSNTLNKAIINNDLILDIEVDDEIVGKIIFDNTLDEQIDSYKRNILLVLIVIITVQIVLMLSYFIYLKNVITNPFKKLNSFAVRVAQGNLDIPLEVDRQHVFGEFSEAFDLMRNELKKARIAEKKANDDKKEIIAKLSHDIKTPVASIKSTSEVGFELTQEERTKEKFNLINNKSDQITALVDNLFNSAIQEATELEVNPGNYNSDIIAGIIETSDYMNKAVAFTIPTCNIFVDKLRLQQVFDNIFMNSYKYANTEMSVSAETDEEYLIIKIADKGDGVKDEELPLLKEKYKRGSNTKEKDGAGLGLYITNYFMDKMNGRMVLKNEHPGFAVYLYIRQI